MSAIRFDDPTRWKVFTDVCVFYEHQRSRPKIGPDGKPVKGKDGQVVMETVKVTKDDLLKACQRSNERDALGQPCPITLGHTQDEADERHQPPIVGYARQFEVYYDHDRKCWAARARKWYMDRRKLAEAEEYPRISPEYWPSARMFDPIAILRRTPQLDLGQWTLSRTSRGEVLRYAATGDWTMPPDERVPPTGGGSPTDPPDANTDDDPAFSDRVMKCVRKSWPHMDKVHEKYSAEFGGGVTPPPGSSTPPSEDERLRMQRSGEVLRYQRELATAQQSIAKLEKENRVARYQRDLQTLCDDGYPIDVQAELADATDMSAEQFARHVERIKRIGEPARGPAGYREVPIADAPAGAQKFQRSHLEKAEAYMAKYVGCDWEMAEEYALGKRKLTDAPPGWSKAS